MSFHVFPLRFCLSLVRFFVSSFRFVLADSQPRSRRVAPASAVRNLWWCGKKTGNPKRFVQSQSKNTRNITKYTEMYWDIQKYDEMWWNMTSTVSNFIVWTGKLRLTPSTTIRWGHSHLLSVSLKAKKRKGNSRNSQSSDELNLATLATLAVAICRFRSATPRFSLMLFDFFISSDSLGWTPTRRPPTFAVPTFRSRGKLHRLAVKRVSDWSRSKQ